MYSHVYNYREHEVDAMCHVQSSIMFVMRFFPLIFVEECRIMSTALTIIIAVGY